MRTIAAMLLSSILATSPAWAAAPEAVSSLPPRTPQEEKAAFHLPEGFEAQLVAAEPEINKPLNIAFDDLGRLWVTDTLEYPFPAPEGQTPRDTVKILDEIGTDGRAKKVTTFATGLNIPIGILPMPFGTSAIVHSIPRVYRIASSNGYNAPADSKQPLFETYGAKDTHGMTNNFTWGFDGWIYACHGFSNESTVAGKDEKSIKMQSGNVYRMRPDGSHLEYVTHGQVNPFGLTFDPLGNLYSCDCHSRPIYQLLPGAWYPSFGKPHDGLGFGPEMTTHDHGSTAISGIAYYAADHFPKPFHDTAFIGNVVTNRINHDRIEWKGATPKAIEQPDFLVSDDPWFRPVDIKLGPDGALYVADFYNRIIGHYEVPLTHPGRDRERGRIWRIIYRGKDGKPGNDPPVMTRFTSTDINRNGPEVRPLGDYLGHPNLVVRTQAANRFVAERSPGACEELVKANEVPARRVHALWVLQRLGKLSDETLIGALKDKDRDLRIHALRVVAERSTIDAPVAGLARDSLKDEDALVRRTAADALARHPDDANIKPLLALRAETPAEDTHLTHVTRMALRDQFLSDDAWQRNDLAKLSDSERSYVADIAPGVPSARAARFLFDQIQTGETPQATLVAYVHHVARYGEEAADGKLLAHLESRQKEAGDAHRMEQVDLLKAYFQGLQERGAKPGEADTKYAWSLAEGLLGSSNAGQVSAGVAAWRVRSSSPGARERLVAARNWQGRNRRPAGRSTGGLGFARREGSRADPVPRCGRFVAVAGDSRARGGPARRHGPPRSAGGIDWRAADLAGEAPGCDCRRPGDAEGGRTGATRRRGRGEGVGPRAPGKQGRGAAR